jgi:protein arginine phosphatase
MKVLFVCTGNTCRSPMAEALIKHEAARRSITGHDFQSAGLNSVPGSRASKYAVEAMAARGIDIDRRMARQITAQMVLEADAVLVMTRNQANTLMDELPQYGAKVHTIGGFAGISGDVDDPFQGNAADYELTARRLEELVFRVLDRLR